MSKNEKLPFPFFEDGLNNRSCVHCRAKKSYIGKNGTAQWYRINGGWVCSTCRQRIVYNLKLKKEIK